jgi:hypothetical protein
LQKFLLKNIKIPIKIIYPQWEIFGKKAGIIRNIEIVKKSDLVFAFWDGKSKGTEFTIKQAKKENINLKLLEVL